MMIRASAMRAPVVGRAAVSTWKGWAALLGTAAAEVVTVAGSVT